MNSFAKKKFIVTYLGLELYILLNILDNKEIRINFQFVVSILENKSSSNCKKINIIIECFLTRF